ncbi:MAG: hypothetical protein NC311_12290 [Muribaculaceae bacterium]|nr:hypothetical protein [Muribaculaceae bacterium]
MKALKKIPLVFAGWLRYLMGVDDDGKEFTPSPDPMLDTLHPYVAGIRLGEKVDGESLRSVLSDAKIFGVDLYAAGMAGTVIGCLDEMAAGKGAVCRTLQKYY